MDPLLAVIIKLDQVPEHKDQEKQEQHHVDVDQDEHQNGVRYGEIGTEISGLCDDVRDEGHGDEDHGNQDKFLFPALFFKIVQMRFLAVQMIVHARQSHAVSVDKIHIGPFGCELPGVQKK